MKSTRHLSALRTSPRFVEKAGSKGERIFGALMPNRGLAWTGNWQSNRQEQIFHLKNWTGIAIDARASMIGQQVPNMAYVRHQRIAGRTHKALKALSVVKPHEELEPIETDHPLRIMMETPNPMDSWYDVAYELDMYQDLTGSGYLWAVPGPFTGPSGNKLPRELWTIPSNWVWPRTGNGDPPTKERPYSDHLIECYEIRPWGGATSGAGIFLPPDQVIPFRDKSPISKIDGWSKLTMGAMSIDTEESIGKSRWAQFQNQALPSFWVELGPGYEDPDDDRLRRIEAKFMTRYQGEFNVGRPMFTPSGAKVTPLSFSPEQMMYIAAEEQIRDMILSLFRVPKVVVGITDTMTFGGNLAAQAGFCLWSINPSLMKLGLGLTKFLAPHFSTPDEPIKIWFDNCVPDDPEQVNKDLDTDKRLFAVTPNEARALRGRKPYQNGGDDPIGPGPGGEVPLPLNTGDSMADLASLIADFGKPPEPEQPEGQEGDEGDESLFGMPKVDEPNGKPEKLHSRLKGSFFADCDRDEAGHCKPGTGGGSDKPDADKKRSIVAAAISSTGLKLMSAKDATKQVASRIGQAAWSKLGEKQQQQMAKTWAVAKSVEHKLMKGFEKSKELAKRAAKERGLSDKHVDTVGKVLAAVDLATAWTVNMPAAYAVTGSATAAKVASWMPVASLAYIGYSTARNPFATIRAAKSMLRKKGRVDVEDLAGELLQRLQDATDPDTWLAAFSVALDDVQDAGKALGMADEAMRGAGPVNRLPKGWRKPKLNGVH